MTKIKEHDIFITTTDTVLGIGGKVNDINKEKDFIRKTINRKNI